MPPGEVAQMQVQANQAYGQLLVLRAKAPIGTVYEVTHWKNQGRS